jgi:hypothetical protein
MNKFAARVSHSAYAKAAVGALVTISTAAANAAIDVAAVATEVGDVKTAVMTIGAAVLSVHVGIKLYKWIKRAL